MSGESPSKRRIGGWVVIAMLAGALVLVLGVSCWWWYVSDGDLRDFRDRARIAGVPLTWADAGTIKADAGRLALWNELGALINDKAMKSWQAGGKAGSGRKPFAGGLDDVRTHHAAIDQLRLSRLLELVDQLGDRPLVLYDRRNFNDPMPEIGRYRSLSRLLQERVWLADDQDVPRECRRLLGLCMTLHAYSLLSELVRTSTIEMALNAVVERLPVLRERDPRIAELLVELDDNDEDSFFGALSGELISAHLVSSNPRLMGPEGESLAVRLGVRASRRELLDRELAWLLFLRSKPDGQATLRYAKALTDFPGMNWDPRYLLVRQMMPALEMITVQSLRCHLRAQLMAAELRGTPWPKDTFDPGGLPLRRWERDGLLVGAYSVDSDGIDNGGDAHKDCYFPLYGPREAPKTTP